jgi:hypothetical protein
LQKRQSNERKSPTNEKVNSIIYLRTQVVGPNSDSVS